MNTNRLKKFAQAARKKLLDQVSSRLELILNTDSAELREKAVALNNLKQAINSSSKAQVIDKVAYTWFNRLMALRFMDANDYQPLGVRIVTPKDGFTLPEILEDTKQGQIPEELKVNRQHIHDLLDGKIPSSNAQNEVYKELLISACNHLHSIFPFLFERIDDYTELLLPDDLTSEFSIVYNFIEGMQEEDCEEVEVIGWLYQFYISERKDEVFASKGKVKKEDIPAATQLFTPRWVVEYMVQNTIGKLWLQNKPSSNLREYMPYYIESLPVVSDDFLKISSVEEITLLDQACGSGHILVSAFDLLTKIYEEEGYNPSEIPQLIIDKNLIGFEIDERAAQLSGIALLLKARSYHRRIFRKELSPNILCFQDLKLNSNEIKETFRRIDIHLTDQLLQDLNNLQHSTNLGSLMIPHTASSELNLMMNRIQSKKNTNDAFLAYHLEELSKAFKQLILLSQKHHCVINNPPYMGARKMNVILSKYINLELHNSRADLMGSFMQRATMSVIENGFISMINFQSWMFLSSFEDLRKFLLKNTTIDKLLHIGRGVFGSDSGTVVFILQNKLKPLQSSYFMRLFEREVQVQSNKDKEQRFLNKNFKDYVINQLEFTNLPGQPISYWISPPSLKAYKIADPLLDIADVAMGLATGDNYRFVRYWFEVDEIKTKRNVLKNEVQSIEETWFPYNKGGEFRKYFGNQELVFNWKNNGSDIKNSKLKLVEEGKITPNNSKCWNESKYFLPSLSWTKVAYDLSVRFYPQGFGFDVGGCSIFSKEDDMWFLLALLNSKLTKPLLGPISPTVNFEPGQIKTFPVLPNRMNYSEKIEPLIKEILAETIVEFNSMETNPSFKKLILLSFNGKSLEENYFLYKEFWKRKFSIIKDNEEKINQELIELYDFSSYVEKTVDLSEITLLKDEIKIKKRELIFVTQEIFIQFMSYAVGCMFGRYSLDKEGLILASQGETLEDFLKKAEKVKSELTYLPDDDNIIPVLDDEWFEDDIVGRFYDFLKASFGKENFDSNLAFVEECLGKDVRNYFVKDFYKDHIKRYKKRPIYWMFSSPKGSFNVLIYMHRYTPDTLNQILNGYLVEYREKLKSRIEHLDHIIVTGSSTEQTKAGKEKDQLKVVLLELQEYEREILYPLATERISIDLDDGVLVNYNRFGKAIQEVKGLNDSKTKKKVRGFDWIDTDKVI